MKTLANLFYTKKKASVRNLFKKPIPALITVILIVTIIGSLYPLLIVTGDKKAMTPDQFSGFALLGTYFSSMMIIVLLFQKKKSLFFVEDSYYMFIGPFSNKQIIGYLIFEIILSSLLLSLMCFLPIAMFGMTTVIPKMSVFLLVLITALVSYTAMILIDYLYVKEMVRGRKSKLQQYLAYVIALGLLIVLGISMVQSNFDIGETLRSFAVSDGINYVPLVGWIRLVLTAHYAGNTLIWTSVLAGVILINLLLSIALINIKGEFYEQAMIDSEDFTEYYKNLRKNGKTAQDNERKIRNVSVTFKEGEMALFSKNKLITMKTGGLFKTMDIVTAGLVIFISYSFGQNILVLGGITLFYAYNGVSTSSLNDDLKHHYVYLIPGKPLKKLLAVILLPTFKVALTTLMTLAIGSYLFKIELIQVIQAVLIAVTFIIVFVAGNVVSLRLMGSRNSKMSEMMIRMVIVTLALLPSIGIMWIMITKFGAIDLALNAMSIIVIACNFIIGMGLLVSCSSMMNGHNISAD